MKLMALIHIFVVGILCFQGSVEAYERSIALVCGKCTQYKDINTGQWITNQLNCKDCASRKEDVLKYCKVMYPGVKILEVKNSTQTENIGKWCKVTDTQSCHGHKHTVTPIICVTAAATTGNINRNIPNDCRVEKETGPCRALYHRYFFNVNSGACEHFIYGGCKGNKNNFESLKECQDTCVPVPHIGIGIGPVVIDDTMTINEELPQDQIKPTKTNTDKGKEDPEVKIPDICTLERATGDCRAAFQRYYFDSSDKSCKKFVFGGCGGNLNNFMTEQECVAACSPGIKMKPAVTPQQEKTKDACTLEKLTGPCRAAFKRFYFDTNDGHCKQFIYGGCRGNSNNFMSLDECSRTCEDLQPAPIVIPLTPPARKLKDDILDVDLIAQYKNQFNGDQTSEDDFYNKALNLLDTQHQGTQNKILDEWKRNNRNLMSDVSLSQQQKEAKLQSYEKTLQEKLHNIDEDLTEKKSSVHDIHNSRTSIILNGAREDALNELMGKLPVASRDEILEKFDNYLLSESDLKDHFNDIQDYANEMVNTNSLDTINKALAELEERVNGTLSDLKTSEFVDDEMSATLDGYFQQYFPPDQSMENNQDVIDFIDTLEPQEDDDGELVEIDNDDENELDSDLLDSDINEEVVFDADDYTGLDNDDVDFDINDVKIVDPLPLMENEGPKVAYFSGSSWLLFAGVAIGALFLVVLIAIFASHKRNASIQIQQPEVKEENFTTTTTAGEEELTAEQKQLLLMQQNGYENPTYKFFEKQKK